jgi:hypothetical protein
MFHDHLYVNFVVYVCELKIFHYEVLYYLLQLTEIYKEEKVKQKRFFNIQLDDLLRYLFESCNVEFDFPVEQFSGN